MRHYQTPEIKIIWAIETKKSISDINQFSQEIIPKMSQFDKVGLKQATPYYPIEGTNSDVFHLIDWN